MKPVLFYEMGFRTQQSSKKAIDTLVEFAPHEIHAALRAQTSKLNEIFSKGMPILGTVGWYKWYLSVWSTSPMHVCLFVGRTDASLLSLAEGLLIERNAIAGVSRATLEKVKIEPRGLQDPRLSELVRANVAGDRHWTTGLI